MIMPTKPEPTPRSAPPEPLPRDGAVPPGVNWHRVEICTTSPRGDQVVRTVEGDDAWVAASLRALADRLDPPKPSRPGLRQQVELGADAMIRRGPGGLVAPPPAYGTPRADPMSTR